MKREKADLFINGISAETVNSYKLRIIELTSPIIFVLALMI